MISPHYATLLSFLLILVIKATFPPLLLFQYILNHKLFKFNHYMKVLWFISYFKYIYYMSYFLLYILYYIYEVQSKKPYINFIFITTFSLLWRPSLDHQQKQCIYPELLYYKCFMCFIQDEVLFHKKKKQHIWKNQSWLIVLNSNTTAIKHTKPSQRKNQISKIF